MTRPFAWEKSYPPGVRWDAPLAASTLPALLAQTMARCKTRNALEFRERWIGYEALGAAIDRTAASFLRAGLGRDRSIGIYLPNTPYHPIALFAAAKAGAQGVPLSPLDSERTLALKLQDSEARTLVTTNFASMLPTAIRLLDAGVIDRVIVGEDKAWGESPIPVVAIPDRHDVISLATFAAEDNPPAAWPSVTPDQIALLQYTGGTTGHPKGAILTHANLTIAISMFDAWLLAQGISRPGEDRMICALPLFHIYALTAVLLRHISHGNEILLRARFDAEGVLRDIEAKHATSFCGVPTMWIALTSVPGVDRRDLASLRYCASGGAPLPIEIGERCRRLFGQRLVGGWGMTETSPAGTAVPLGGPEKPGTIGVPLPGIEMDVVSLADPRQVLPPGEVGEIRIRGPNVTAGYWKRPEETAAAFVDGWFLTGDVGRMDEDGYFFLVDRKKDMIISSGFNVYPTTIEQALYEHPDVEEAVVIGVPDPYRGEAAKVFVKLREGAPGLTLEALRAFLGDKLGRHEMPAALALRDALPRTPVGKLSRLALREEERGKGDRGPAMDLRFTEQELAFRDEVRGFLAARLPESLREKLARGEHAAKEELVAWTRVLNAKGWAVPGWPVEWGGTGWTPVERYIFEDELQQAPAPQPLPFGVSMVGPVIIAFGNEAQKRRFLPRIANLDDWWCQGFSEPGSGSDLASLRTTAKRDGDAYVVNGQKTWTTLAQHADWIFCLVRTDPAAKKQEGISFLLIDMRSPGVTVRPIQTIDGGFEVNEVFLDEVRVPVENLVGRENKGWDYAKFLLGNERTGIARVGQSKQWLKRIRMLAAQERDGDRPLIESRRLREKLAAVEVELAALEITQLRVVAAEAGRAHGKPDPASSILKIKGSEIQQQLTELLLEVAGAYALPFQPGPHEGRNEPPAGPDWARLAAPGYFNYRKVSIYGGSNEIQKNIIAKAILGL